MTTGTTEMALDWRSASGLLLAMEEESGSNPSRGKEQRSASPSLSTPESGVRPRWNLLLAEDNLPDALLVKECIRRSDLPLNLHIVNDGERAIDFIGKSEEDPEAPRPDIVVLDLNLPRRDGFEVLRRLRGSQRFRDIPALVFSSSDSESDRANAAQLGARYFRKPPNYDQFMRLGDELRELLAEHGLL